MMEKFLKCGGKVVKEMDLDELLKAENALL